MGMTTPAVHPSIPTAAGLSGHLYYFGFQHYLCLLMKSLPVCFGLCTLGFPDKMGKPLALWGVLIP